MNKQIEAIAQREVTRKQFLATLGFGIMSIMGIGSIIKLLSGKHTTPLEQHVNHGYGNSTYGGSKD